MTRPFPRFFRAGPGDEVLLLCNIPTHHWYTELLHKLDWEHITNKSTLKQLIENYQSNFALFKALPVCNQRSLLEWNITLIVTGVLGLVVAIVIIIIGTVVSYTKKSESSKAG